MLARTGVCVGVCSGASRTSGGGGNSGVRRLRANGSVCGFAELRLPTQPPVGVRMRHVHVRPPSAESSTPHAAALNPPVDRPVRDAPGVVPCDRADQETD